MATKDLINLGTAPDTGTGDSARKGGEKINTIFVDTYTTLGDNPVDIVNTNPTYGQRTVFGSTEFKVGDLHPAGKWNKLQPSLNSLSTFTPNRGDQLIINLDGYSDPSFEILLPHAVPGDVVKIRDGFGNWSSTRSLNIKTSALNPDLTSGTVNRSESFIYDPNNTLLNGAQGALSSGSLTFTNVGAFTGTPTITALITSAQRSEVNTITYSNSGSTSGGPTTNVADDALTTSLSFNLGAVGSSVINFRTDAQITLEITDASGNLSSTPIILDSTKLSIDAATNIVTILLSDITAAYSLVGGDFDPLDADSTKDFENGADTFKFTVVTPSSFNDINLAGDFAAGSGDIVKVNDDTISISASVLEANTDFANATGTAGDDDELKIGDSFNFTVTTVADAWGLKGQVGIGHVNINGINYSNISVAANTNSNGYSASITASTSGFLLDTPFTDVEFFFASYTEGWRAQVTSIDKSVSLGTVIFDQPFYNTKNYSGTDEQAVVYTETGTALALTVTNFDDAATETRRTNCNTIIIDDNWVLNGSTNGIILNDPQTTSTDSSDQWTIYMPLPQTTSNWDSVLGKRFSIVNNSELPVIIKPLVFDFTNAATITAIENDIGTYSSITTTAVSNVFNGLTGNSAWTLANFALIDANTSTGGLSSRLSVEYPGLTGASLINTPADLEYRFDESIKSITVAFTADNNISTTTTGVPSEGREYAWRVINTENRTVTPQQREFVVVTDTAAATTAANARGTTYNTPTQVNPTYLTIELPNNTTEVNTTPSYEFVKAGDGTGVSHIVTGLVNADPFASNTLAQFAYASLEVYKNGLLLQEGQDWKAFTAEGQTGIISTSGYTNINALTSIDYAFSATQTTRVEEVNSIEFTTALLNGDRVEVHWIPLVSLPSSLNASIVAVVQNQVSSLTNSINASNEFADTFTAESNVLANLGTTNVSDWQNNEITNNNNLNPTGGWYLEYAQGTHNIGTTPHVNVYEAIATSPTDLPGFTTPGLLEATVRIFIDSSNTVFITADQPFSGTVSFSR